MRVQAYGQSHKNNVTLKCFKCMIDYVVQRILKVFIILASYQNSQILESNAGSVAQGFIVIIGGNQRKPNSGYVFLFAKLLIKSFSLCVRQLLFRNHKEFQASTATCCMRWCSVQELPDLFRARNYSNENRAVPWRILHMGLRELVLIPRHSEFYLFSSTNPVLNVLISFQINNDLQAECSVP